MENNSVLLIPGADLQYRNADSSYPFRQDSSFYYFSGFCESSSLIAIVKNQNKINSIIFVPPKDKLKEIWENPDAMVTSESAAGSEGSPEDLPGEPGSATDTGDDSKEEMSDWEKRIEAKAAGGGGAPSADAPPAEEPKEEPKKKKGLFGRSK